MTVENRARLKQLAEEAQARGEKLWAEGDEAGAQEAFDEAEAYLSMAWRC